LFKNVLFTIVLFFLDLQITKKSYFTEGVLNEYYLRIGISTNELRPELKL